MGRHRRYPVKGKGIIKDGAMTPEDHENIMEVIERRLGLRHHVCSNCGIKTKNTDSPCKRCCQTDYRKRRAEYADA